jgi:hypothetical protein
MDGIAEIAGCHPDDDPPRLLHCVDSRDVSTERHAVTVMVALVLDADALLALAEVDVPEELAALV